MDATWLRTIEQVVQFLAAKPRVAFTTQGPGGAADNVRYEQISRMLACLGSPRRQKRERGVLLP